MTPNETTKLPTGFFLAYMLGVYFVMSLAIALAWNCGLYGSQLVDHKISFVTALGLAVIVNLVRYVLTAASPKNVTQHVNLNRVDE